MRSRLQFILLRAIIVLLGSFSGGRAQVVPLLTYNGQITDPGNPTSGVLHRFTVVFDDLRNDPFRHIAGISIRFESIDSGIYQLQNNLSASPVDTVYQDDLGTWPQAYRDADSHLLFDDDELETFGFPTEGNEGVALGADGLFHCGSMFLYSAGSGIDGAARVDPLPVAQIIVIDGGWVTLTGMLAVDGVGHPVDLPPLSFPEPAALGLMAFGSIAMRRRHA